jgi:hypothetical protein
MSRFTRCFIIFVVIVLSLCSSLVAPAVYGRLSDAAAAGEVYADGIFDGTGRVAVRILDAETGVACYALMADWGNTPAELKCLKFR